MMNEKQTLVSLLENAEGKKLLFLGREGIFTQKEIERFLKKYNVAMTNMLEEDVAGVVEHHSLNPVEEDISNDAYDRKLPLFKLNAFERLLSEEIDDDSLLMAIKLGNDQERVLRLLGNEHISDTLFVKLLKLYRFDEEEEDSRQDRDVIMYTLRRYIEIKPNEEDLLYSYLTLRRLATEATDPELLKALMGFPNFEFLIRGKEKVTLYETIARNTFVDEEAVRKLLSFRALKVDRALAGNRSVPAEVLRHLLSKNNVMIQKALASNRAIDDEMFGALLEKEEEVVALLMVRQPITMQRYSMIIQRYTDKTLFALLGANESLEKEVVEALLKYDDTRLLEALSANPSLEAVQLQSLFEKGEQGTHPVLAKNPSVPTAVLEVLYTLYRHDSSLLALLAHNPSLPESLLRALFAREDFEINRGLATNASVPRELLEILKVDTRLQNELAQNEIFAAEYEQMLNYDAYRRKQ